MSEGTIATISFFLVLGAGGLALHLVDRRQERDRLARQERAKQDLQRQIDSQKSAREAQLKTAAGRIELAIAKEQEFDINNNINLLFQGLKSDMDVTIRDEERIVFSDVSRNADRLSFRHSGVEYGITIRGSDRDLPRSPTPEDGYTNCGGFAIASAIVCVNGEIVYETSKGRTIEAYVDGVWTKDLADIALKLQLANERLTRLQADEEHKKARDVELADVERRGACVVFDANDATESAA